MITPDTIWALVDRDYGENITAVYPTELDALRVVNGRGYGRVVELNWGETLIEKEER